MAHGEHGYLFANVVPVGSMSWDLEGAAENIGVKSGEGDEMILVHRLAFFFFFWYLVFCLNQVLSTAESGWVWDATCRSKSRIR